MIAYKQQGELDYIEVSNQSAVARIALQGAHTFFFQAKNKDPLLWLSETATFEKTKAIRGGIPICWPWFGEHKTNPTLAKHGFARNKVWTLHNVLEKDTHTTIVTLALHSDEETKKLFDYEFELLLEIIIGETLVLSLTTMNTDTKPFIISEALHTYFAIEDIDTIHIRGLEENDFYDQVEGKEKQATFDPLLFVGETDRVYHEVIEELLLVDVSKTVTIQSQGAKNCVVWNPGAELTIKMPDLHSHKQMVCIETANVMNNTLEIKAGKSHILRVELTL